MISSFRSGDWLTLDRLRIYPMLLLIMFSAALLLLSVTAKNGVDRFNRPLGTDFSEIWVAGLEVREGHPELAYDIQAHKAKQARFFGQSPDFYLWSYPPYFLGIAALLAIFPYVAALFIWQAVTLTLFVRAVLAILKPLALTWTQTLIPALAFPAVFVNLAHGQNGFLTAALLVGGLITLRERPITAGILFACLAYKPQFAVMVPVALIAGGYWRCVFSGTVAFLLLTLCTWLFFGSEVWLSFPGAIAASKAFVLEQGGAGYDKMQSLFAMARLLGASIQAAYALQAATFAALAVGLAWLWHSPADARLKGAALLTSALLATPYSFDYDMVILEPALAMMLSYALENGFRPYEKSLLACVWISPLIARPLATAAHVPIGAGLMLMFFLAILHRAFQDKAALSRPDLTLRPAERC